MPDVVHLWPDGAPGSEAWSHQEADYIVHDPQPHRVTRNVTDPTLTVYLPEVGAATGTGVIVCPGGAYHFLAVDHEGAAVAQWLNARGIAAFMLKYRVIATPADDAAFLETRPASRAAPASAIAARSKRRCRRTGRWRSPMACRRCASYANMPHAGACGSIASAC